MVFGELLFLAVSFCLNNRPKSQSVEHSAPHFVAHCAVFVNSSEEVDIRAVPRTDVLRCSCAQRQVDACPHRQLLRWHRSPSIGVARAGKCSVEHIGLCSASWLDVVGHLQQLVGFAPIQTLMTRDIHIAVHHTLSIAAAHGKPGSVCDVCSGFSFFFVVYVLEYSHSRKRWQCLYWRIGSRIKECDYG